MMNFTYSTFPACRLLWFLYFIWLVPQHAIARVEIPTQPLLTRASVAPMNLLVVGKDHMLYTGAYDDTVDLDPERHDGIDIGFRPSKIKYTGYFNPDLCYDYDKKFFIPMARFLPGVGCAGTRWSGSFLNYVSMSRMDLIRKSLYGGKRISTQGPGDILERSRLPLDAHVWGKEFNSILPDGSSLSAYVNTGASLKNFPDGTGTQTIASGLKKSKLWVANMDVDSEPSIRMTLATQNANLSEWIRTENNDKLSEKLSAFAVRVRVCDENDLDLSRCRNYQGRNRPIGLIQKYGSSDGVKFGLMTGSYDQPKAGGVLRAPVRVLADEVLENGSFVEGGIVDNLDRLKINKPKSSYEAGGDGNWGNPMAEMLYEAVRYYSGKSAASPAYVASASVDQSIGLTRAEWANPFEAKQGRAQWCAKPFVTLIGNAITSFDTDLPGSAFNSTSSDIGNLNVSKLATDLARFEPGVFPGSVLVGEVSGSTENINLPTSKLANSFNIRGVSPDEPSRQGGYYSAAIAYHARTQGLFNSAFPVEIATDDEKRPRLKTFAIAAMNPIPKISVGGVEVMPYGRVVNNGPANTLSIVSFVLKEYLPGSFARFTVNFDDAEDGADYDLDAIVDYTITFNEATRKVKIKVESTYAQSGYWNHMGFIVSGVKPLAGASEENKAGAYLVVREKQLSGDTAKECIKGNQGVNPLNYGLSAGSCPVLPLIFEKEFEVDRLATTAKRLEDPLWYTAKYGGFSGESTFKNERAQWDADGDGSPDAYFLASNPLKLEDQFEAAFRQISQQSGAATAGASSSRDLASGPLFLKVGFQVDNWEGDLRANKVTLDRDGHLVFSEQWNARSLLQSKTDRQVVFGKGSTGGRPFLAENGLPSTFKPALIDYLRGDATNEGKSAGKFRPRPNTKLGDIHASSPVYYSYGPLVDRIFVGANDGMLHVFDAKTGVEKFAFIPNKVLDKLPELASQTYTHQFYVDGALTIGKVDEGQVLLAGGLGAGGKGWFLLNVTDPEQLTENNAAAIVKWELSDADDTDIGFSYGKPHIVRLNDNKFWVLLPNGYNSTAGKAGLLLVPLDRPASGWAESLVKIMVPDVGGNGLSDLTPYDLNKDGKIDLVYAGDIKGNIWRFDLSGEGRRSWSVSPPVRLFSARGADNQPQPIVAAPALAAHPAYQTAGISAQAPNLMVMVGTGKFFENCDKLVSGCSGESRVNTVYGLWDSGVPVCSRDELLVQTLGKVVKGGVTYRTVSNKQPQWVGFEESKTLSKDCASRQQLAGSHLGWRQDLNLSGERVVDSLRYENKMLQYQTYLPPSSNDACTPSDESYLIRVNVANGGHFTKSRLNDPQIDAIKEPEIVGRGASGSLGSVDLRQGGKVFSVLSSTVGAEIVPIEWRIGRTVGRVTWREILETN